MATVAVQQEFLKLQGILPVSQNTQTIYQHLLVTAVSDGIKSQEGENDIWSNIC